MRPGTAEPATGDGREAGDQTAAALYDGNVTKGSDAGCALHPRCRLRAVLLAKDKAKPGENGGIGTPATRDSIVMTLFKRGFL